MSRPCYRVVLDYAEDPEALRAFTGKPGCPGLVEIYDHWFQLPSLRPDDVLVHGVLAPPTEVQCMIDDALDRGVEVIDLARRKSAVAA